MQGPSNKSFSSIYRLRSKRDFAAVQNAVSSGSGRKLHCRNFLLLVAPAQGKVSRLGVTVTLKIDKRSVVRNRIKRLTREVFRNLRESLKSPIEMIVIARNGAIDCGLPQVESQIKHALKNGGYL